MKNNVVKTIIGAAALSSSAIAGPIDAPVVTEPQAHCGDYCHTLKNIGKLYVNKDNPYIQEVSIFGRAQGQYAYVDGTDVNDQDFNRDFEEVRRLRAGIKIKAFNGFQLKANVNLEDDDSPTGGDRDFGYQDFDQAKLSYKKKDFLGFDSLSLTYGRHKIAVGQESATSSKKIKTVERSSIANRLTSNRYTGFTLTGKRNGIEGTIGYLSLEESDFIAGFDAGSAIYASTEFAALNGDVRFDFFYNLDDGSSDDEVGVGYEWAFAAGWQGKVGSWDLQVDAAVGDNGDTGNDDRDGTFYGLTVMPSKYIVADKVEFVARYAFQGATEDEGIRTNSRYLRRSEIGSTDLGSGRGDQHHSIYAGLNYYFCGHNSKILTGVEYETLDAQDGDVDATTIWLAYRTYF